jgi:hypothetical protein
VVCQPRRGGGAILVEHPIYKAWRKMRFCLSMGKQYDIFGKFVRLNLIGEIVEVVDCDSTEITINHKGRKYTMDHHEVSRLTPEEAATAAYRVSS